MTRHTSPTGGTPLDPRVWTLLDVAAAPAETASPVFPGEDEALAAFRASPHRIRRISMLSPLVSARAAVASAIGTGVLLPVGAAAAAGVLPGAAQETVSTWLETVGISVPAGKVANENGDPSGGSGRTPGEKTDENANVRGGSEDSPVEKAEPPAADDGKQVSDSAKNTTAEGADKGKRIAGDASDGRTESGDRGSAGNHDREPPVSAPHSGDTNAGDTNSGDAGNASDATEGQEQSAGASDEGQAKADESSEGASSRGSENSSARR
jgi:hypothetical protein